MADRNNKLGGTDWIKEHPTFQDLNDTNNIIINNSEIGDCELAVRTLQANNVFVQGPTFIVDEFLDADGTKNTVNTGTSTSAFSTDKYILNFTDEASGDTTSNVGNYTNPDNAFDSDSATYAEKSVTTTGTTYRLGKTFASKFIGLIHYKTSNISTNVSADITLTLQKYSSSTWSNIATISINPGDTTIASDETFLLDETVEGIGILMTNSGGDTSTARICRIYDLEYGDYNSSDTLVIDSNTTSLDGNEKGFAVSVSDSSLPTNTSMTVIFSDGTNSLTAQTINTVSKGVVVGNSSANGGPLSSGTLKVTFTLATTDTSITPTLLDYGIKILR